MWPTVFVHDAISRENPDNSVVGEMFAMRTLPIAFGLLIFSGLAFATDDEDLTLQEDRQRLHGKWMMRGPGHEWQMNFDPAGSIQIAVSWKERGGTWAATGWTWNVKKNSNGSYIELEPFTAEASDLPSKLDFSFNGDKLVLHVSEGPLYGHHEFERYMPPGSSRLPWMAGGSVLIVIAIAASLIVFRKWHPSPKGT